ncbi:MAG: glycoside hydrolase, partial [Muriicola sp.]|nr:glycoside hydrolase [Muriicola sp.]
AEKCPFLIQDPLFNAMLIRSNESLIRLGTLLHKVEAVRQLKAWNENAKKNFQSKLYDRDLQAYIYFDLRAGRPMKHVSSSSFAPLFAGIPSKEVATEIAKHYFKQGSFSGQNNDFLLCASFDPKSTMFDPKRYWRGPVWINLNWIIYHGFKRYGFEDLADQIKADTLYLLEKYGFYEYFDPRREVHQRLDAGYGGNNFSWSAALYIDLLNNTKE